MADIQTQELSVKLSEAKVEVKVAKYTVAVKAAGVRGATGQAATIAVGTTTTGVPGTPAEVVNVGSSSAAVFDFTIPEGIQGIQGIQGYQAEVEVGNTVTLPPGSPASVSDRDPSPHKSLLDFAIPAGEYSTIFEQPEQPDFNSRPAGYPLWLDTDEDPGAVPLVEYDNTNDVKYEAKSELLKEAAWWIDAGAVGYMGDRLVDMSGNSRDALFGAGAAKPVVLPWDGEDYLYIPNSGQYFYHSIPTVFPMVSTLTFDVDISADYQYLVIQDPGVGGMHVAADSGALIVGWDKGGQQYENVAFYGAAPPGRRKITVSLTAANASATVDGVNWGTLSYAAPRPTALTGCYWYVLLTKSRLYSLSLDKTLIFNARDVNHTDYTSAPNPGSAGGTWGLIRTASGMKTAVVDRPLLLFGGAQTANVPGIHNLDVNTGGTVVVAMRAHNGSSGPTNKGIIDYGDGAPTYSGLSIYFSSGNPSQDISATALGVDQTQIKAGWPAIGVAASVGTRTSARVFWNGSLVTAKSQVVPGIDYSRAKLGIGSFPSQSGAGPAEFEFLAGAIWSRVLTDAEIAQVSQELVGKAHAEQPNPHPQYLWPSVAVWADLPNPAKTPIGSKYHVASGLGLCVAMNTPTGWKVAPESDTGPLRDISHRLVNGWTVYSTRMRIRRIGMKALIEWDNLNGAAATDNVILDVPAGWKSVTFDGQGATAVSSSSYSGLVDASIRMMDGSGLTCVAGRTAIVTGHGHVEYTSTDTIWPTTAP